LALFTDATFGVTYRSFRKFRYLVLKTHQVNVPYKDFWMVKTPLKIKVFCRLPLEIVFCLKIT
jgi:hypothetical protein